MAKEGVLPGLGDTARHELVFLAHLPPVGYAPCSCSCVTAYDSQSACIYPDVESSTYDTTHDEQAVCLLEDRLVGQVGRTGWYQGMWQSQSCMALKGLMFTNWVCEPTSCVLHSF